MADNRSCLDGLWLLLVQNHSALGHTPIMARAENEETFVLGFRNAAGARRFLKGSTIDGAEPRMVVNANRANYLQIAQDSGARGVLVDYDPNTNDYVSASELF